MTQTSLFPRETVEFVTLRPVAFAVSKFYDSDTARKKIISGLVWQAPDGTEHLDVAGIQPRFITDRIVLQVVRQASANG